MQKSTVLWFSVFIAACGGGSGKPDASGTDGTNRPSDSRIGCGIGVKCQTAADCRPGLVCLPSNAGSSYCTNPECESCFGPQGGVCTYDIDTCAYVECLTKRDGSVADAPLDVGKTCAIGTACVTDGDCASGLTCQKFDVIEGVAGSSSMICAPPTCTTCKGQTCVVDTKKTCSFVSCKIGDGGVPEAKLDAGIDALTCEIAKPCAKNSDCSSGLTCQKIGLIDGQSVNAMVCMPSQCPSCNPRTCVYNNDPKVCAFVECRSDDAGIVDASADKPKADVAPIDAMPVPLSDMPPSMAAACPGMASAPCGGDLSGDWTIIGICDPYLSVAELVSQEAKECSTWIDYIDHGTASFGSGGVCIVDEKYTYNNSYSTKCLAEANDTCVAKDGRIKKEIGKDYITDASCAVSSSEACMCTNTFDPPAAADACTYTVAGDTLTFVSPPKTFSAKSYGYCVQGNTLSVFFGSSSAAGEAAGKKAAVVMVKASTIDAGTNGQ